MNRMKVFSTVIVAVLLIIMITTNIFAKSLVDELDDSGHLYIKSATWMYERDDLFCVEHGQKLTKSDKYRVIASIHLRGKQLTLNQYAKSSDFKKGEPSKTQIFDAEKYASKMYSYNKDDLSKKLSYGTLVERTNILAAIFYTSGLSEGKHNVNLGTVSGQQLTLWWYWNTWVKSLPQDGVGIGGIDWGGLNFKVGSKNKDLIKSEGYSSVAQKNLEKVKKKAETEDFSIDLYYLDNTNSSSWQALILVDKIETVNIPVKKVWEDSSGHNDYNRDGKRPSTVYAELYANGKSTGKKVALSASNNWKNTFTGLAKKDSSGNTITYTVKEYLDENLKKALEEGYTTAVSGNATNGFTITNTYEPERVKLKVVKEWNDSDDLDEYRPESIKLRLLRTIRKKNGTVEEQVWYDNIVLNEENGWEFSSENNFKYYEGTKVKYTFEEVDVPDGYKVSIDSGTTVDVNGEDEDYELITYTMTNTHEPNYDGYIEITGKVWEDRPDGKANNINGTFDDDESGLEGIKVRLKDANGNDIKSTYTDGSGNFTRTDYAYTKADGSYTIRVNYDNSENVYKLYEDEETVRTKLSTAYVEFEYDGMTYTTVATASTGTNTSKAIENETQRNNFDSKHSTTEISTQYPDNWTDKAITATTQNVIKSFDSYMDYKNGDVKENYETRNETVTVKYCNGDGTYTRTDPKDNTKTITSDLPADHPDDTNHNSQGHSMREFDIEVGTIKNVNLGLFKREQPDVALFSDIKKVEVTMNQQKYTYLYGVRGANLEADITAQFQNKDVYTYRRPVNPADIAYINEPANVDKELMEVYVTYAIEVGNLSSTLPITVNSIINAYDSDYEVQYIVKGKENFEALEAGNKTDAIISSTTSQVYGSSTGFNEMTLTGLNITVQPQMRAGNTNTIYIKYKVNADEIRSLLNEESSLHNASEIASYSTLYGSNTLYAEQGKGGRTNKPYGGYDYDSHPGNAAIEKDTTTYTYTDNDGNVTTYENVEILKSTKNLVEYTSSDGTIKLGPEDDTDIAPSFILHKDEEKTFSGNVWVDTDIGEETGSDNFRVGNGVKDSNEQDLANAKVELYKVNDDGTTELAKLRSSDGNGLVDAITYTDENGNYKFGNDEYGIVTDKYLIKFIYGEGIDNSTTSTIQNVNVNARDYKSTIISEGTELYNIFKGTSNSDEWHLNISKGYSIAVDDMEQRVAISDLQYSTFDDQINITAESKPFEMQVEYDPSENKTSQVSEDGKTAFGNDLNVFDFGIIERAREDVFVEKNIEYIKITLADGRVLTEGNPNEQELNYAKAIGFGATIDNSNSARKAKDKVVTIEMDAELIQQAQLDVTYAIKVTNYSEKDYDYYLGDEAEEYDESKVRTEFYYFGTHETDKDNDIIKASINGLVDYVDSDLEYKWEDADWKEITIAELRETGKELISEKSAEALNTAKYKAYITEKYSNLAPGQSSEPEIAKASKLLSNTDEDQYQNIFENHIEILKIDSKTGRTIKETNNGVPVIKQYKSGNYVPSLETRVINTDISKEEAGLHEQDDDRVKITITPPTGLMDNIIIYVITGLVALIIIVVGVVIIKKKILIK